MGKFIGKFGIPIPPMPPGCKPGRPIGFVGSVPGFGRLAIGRFVMFVGKIPGILIDGRFNPAVVPGLGILKGKFKFASPGITGAFMNGLIPAFIPAPAPPALNAPIPIKKNVKNDCQRVKKIL